MARRSLCWTFFLAFVVSFGPAASSAEPDSPAWLRGSGRELELRVHGEVVDAQGAPATGASLTGGINSHLGHKSLDIQFDGHRFVAWIPVNRWLPYSLWIKASAADGSGLAVRKLSAFDLRTAASGGLRLTLTAPARRVAVRVLADGQPMPNAMVQAELDFGVTMRATTGANGVARLELLDDQALSGLMAWTDDRVGGYGFNRKPTRDPLANDHIIELSACREQTIRFVDDSGATVAGVPFLLQVATPPPNYNYVGANEHSHMTTDARGEAVQRWFPDWEQHHCYAELETADWVLVDDKPTWVDRVMVFRLSRPKPRHSVAGRVQAGGQPLPGLYVSARSFQGERENYSDSLNAWTDAAGNYTFDVLPDATYCLYGLDAYWVTPIVDRIVYDAQAQAGSLPAFEAQPGQLVEVQATTGQGRRPYANLPIGFLRMHDFKWEEKGETHRGTQAAQWRVVTDTAGRATTRTYPGSLKTRVYTPVWRAEQDDEIVAGVAKTIHLHRDDEARRRIAGQLVLPAGSAANLAGMPIQWGAVDGNFDDGGVLASDADGRFAFETAATEVALFVASKDGDWAGSQVVNEAGAEAQVLLQPTACYQGRLLGEGDRPLADHRVKVFFRIESSQREPGRRFVARLDALRLETRTDAQGRFVFQGVPLAAPAQLMADAVDGGGGSAYLDEFYLEEGEQRPPSVYRLVSAAAADATPLPERFAKLRRDGRLNGFHLLVITSDGGAAAAEFVERNLVDHEVNPEVMNFLQLTFAGKDGQLGEQETAFLRERDWTAPAAGRVAAWALDAHGHELGRSEFDPASPTAVETAKTFLREHSPTQLDARRKWDDAFAEAQRTNRRVWARIGQRYCGPCFRLARWMDEQHEQVSKDYVLLKIDNARDLHGEEVAGRLTRGQVHGIPFHVIFAADGQLLIDSAGRLGNVGNPTGFEGRKHLRKMLLASRQRLSDAEVEELVESVAD